MTRRIRPRTPAVRASNHWLRALSGWKRTQRQAICMSWARIQAGPSQPIPWSRWTSPLAHGVGVRSAQLASSHRLRKLRVEHVFGAQSNDMGGTLVRSVRLVRAKARIGLKNLAYNMRRLVQLERLAAAV